MFATPKNICGWWSMKITAQLPGVNRPLSVELRLINFCSCVFDSREKHHTSSSRGLLAKRSDFPKAEGLVRCSRFGGGQIRREIKATLRQKSPKAAPVHGDLRP